MTWKSSEGVGTGYFSNIFGVFRLSYPRFSDDVFRILLPKCCYNFWIFFSKTKGSPRIFLVECDTSLRRPHNLGRVVQSWVKITQRSHEI